MKHFIKIDFHESKASRDNICLLGAEVKEQDAKPHLTKIDEFLSDIWDKSLAAQEEYNNLTEDQKLCIEVFQDCIKQIKDPTYGDLVWRLSIKEKLDKISENFYKDHWRK